jgi:AraC-like DNA-binding protein
MDNGKAPVGRFAPTPSGRMHLGNVFAALIAWLSVRSRNGSLVLRMEDLDTQRTSSEFADILRSDLRWLGLDWDMETLPQSQRTAVYDRYFEKLSEMGLLYPCYCTRSQLHNVNAPHLSDGTYVYAGTCKNVIGNKEMRLSAGDLLLYNLQTVHKLILDDPDAVVFNILAGREVFSQSFLNLFSENNPVLQFYIHSLYDIPGDQYCAFHLSGNDALNPLHNMIAEFIRKEAMYEKIMYLDFQNLLVRLSRIRLSTRSELSVTNNEGLDINTVLTYVHDNYTDVTLQSLSDHFSYTTRSMIRFLKKYTHKTFSEILRDFRMLSACNLLRNSNTPIDGIALQTGFSERSYFDRVFKQTFHVTPAEYRSSMI